MAKNRAILCECDCCFVWFSNDHHIECTCFTWKLIPIESCDSVCSSNLTQSILQFLMVRTIIIGLSFSLFLGSSQEIFFSIKSNCRKNDYVLSYKLPCDGVDNAVHKMHRPYQYNWNSCDAYPCPYTQLVDNRSQRERYACMKWLTECGMRVSVLYVHYCSFISHTLTSAQQSAYGERIHDLT